MKWTDQDIQRIFNLYHGLWPDKPAPEEWDEFLSLVKDRIRPHLVAAAIRRTKQRHSGRNFRPAMSVFFFELENDLPQAASSTSYKAPTGEQNYDPAELLDRDIKAGTAPEWLQGVCARRG